MGIALEWEMASFKMEILGREVGGEFRMVGHMYKHG